MNVNSGKPRRVRRTPEQARALILQVAADRLDRLGLGGLNISGVAKDAGMSHGTVIHHFGSTSAMRQALLEQMTGELLGDVMTALDHREPPERILDRLFRTLSQGGHGKLLAWMAVEPQAFEAADQGGMFKSIIDAIAEKSGDREHARHTVFLVALAAMGLSISGDNLATLLGLSQAEQSRFPGWLAAHLETL